MDGTEFTVFFEDPFWVGILVDDRDGRRRIARVVFGAEPTNAELLVFMRECFSRFLAAARSVPRSEVRAECPLAPISAKRGARMAARDQKGGPRKAIAAAHAAFELAKAEARQEASRSRETRAEHRFVIRQEKKKAARKGR